MTTPVQAPSDAGTERYAQFDGEGLILAATGVPAASLAARVHGAFCALVLDPEFPCVAARSALNQAS